MLLKSNSKTQAQDWLSPGWAQRAGLGLGSSLARASLTSHTPGRRALPPGVPRAWWCDAVGRARSGRAVPPGTWRGWQREGQRLAGTGLGETCGRRASGAAAGPGRGRAGLGPPAPQLAGGSDPPGLPSASHLGLFLPHCVSRPRSCPLGLQPPRAHTPLTSPLSPRTQSWCQALRPCCPGSGGRTRVPGRLTEKGPVSLAVGPQTSSPSTHRTSCPPLRVNPVSPLPPPGRRPPLTPFPSGEEPARALDPCCFGAALAISGGAAGEREAPEMLWGGSGALTPGRGRAGARTVALSQACLPPARACGHGTGSRQSRLRGVPTQPGSQCSLAACHPTCSAGQTQPGFSSGPGLR